MNETALFIKNLISKEGPISLEKYTEICIQEYYSNNNTIGKEGDFITAPEISQVFGELIGLWCLTSWEKLGKPKDFSLVELGPGRGTLMSDILRSVETISHDFIRYASIYLIETSSNLIEKQKTNLSKYNIKWLNNYTQLPQKPMIILGNEFLDALPIRQFIKVKDNWHERLVTYEDNNFLFTKSNFITDKYKDKFINAPDGSIFEISENMNTMIDSIAKLFLKNPGISLFIDYGYLNESIGDTLQAVKNHKFSSVFKNPGSNDLTAHVNFSEIKKSAKKNQNNVFGPIEQGDWLKRLGIYLRLQKLIENQHEKNSFDLINDINRLISPDQMGKLFKVISFSSPQINKLEGF